ncbi:unnamed protein product [Ilex paraguariensis]|uniref:FBD domain-containing protein n=1 Tax=Ilex paraguariensis TaxID=185542 RepID=A0ABC8U189_9AQUA
MKALDWSSYKLPVFHNLTCLELGAGCPGWLLLPKLLESSPQLRTLVFKEGLWLADDEHYWDHCGPVPTCLLFNLKVIDIGAFKGKKGELKIVKYFLKNAEVLETLNVSPLMPEAEELKITKLLLKIPRGSSSCKVVS